MLLKVTTVGYATGLRIFWDENISMNVCSIRSKKQVCLVLTGYQVFVSIYVLTCLLPCFIIGIGGMAAASILSKHGRKVLVLERHDKIGGCTHTFSWSSSNLDGSGFSTCEFDTGCHYCAVDMAFDTARSGAIMKYVTDSAVKWNDLGDPYDRLVLPHDSRVDKDCPNNDSYDFLCGADRLVEEISQRINPNEPKLKPRLKTFLEFCRVAHNTIIPLYLVRLFPRWLEGVLEPLYSKFFAYGKITTAQALDSMISHGFTAEEVLSKKSIPKEEEEGLENTWRRVKGKAENFFLWANG